MEKGQLHIVSTPIGNLKDITLRAIEVLKSVDVILSEDTRETLKILKAYEIGQKSQISYRDQNHTRVVNSIKSLLDDGKSLALVSDSGTPLVSDPGFKLVSELSQQGYKIVTIPGPSAVVSALSVSGLPTDKFIFIGFLPRTKSQIDKIISEYCNLEATVAFYESPYRINDLLKAVFKICGDRKACLVNDLTKMHECVNRGKVSDLIDLTENSKLRGEFVLLVAKKDF